MRLAALEISAVRGLRDGTYPLVPDRGGPGHVTVVTGPPRAGLTSFLDAVAFSAARLAFDGIMPDSADIVRESSNAAMIRTTWWLDTDERAFGGVTDETLQAEVVFKRKGLGRADADPAVLGLMARYDHTPGTSKVVLLPARRVMEGAMPLMGGFEAEQRLKRLSPDTAKFGGLAQALVKHATGFGDRARFEAVQRLFNELCGSTTLADVSSDKQLSFVPALGRRVPLQRLSLSEHNAFVLAAVPILLGLDRSVILLDTPEMGLAPGVAGRWMEALRRSTPEAQWIVASRDPDVVASVERSAVVDLGVSGLGMSGRAS